MVIDDDYLKEYLEQLGYVKTRCKNCQHRDEFSHMCDKGHFHPYMAGDSDYCSEGEPKCANG